MRVFFDTSAVVTALVDQLPNYEAACSTRWLAERITVVMP